MSVKWMDPLKGNNTFQYKNDNLIDTVKGIANGNNITSRYEFENLKSYMATNKLFSKDDIQIYDKVSRFGFIPLYTHDQVTREYLFFTRPDLNLFRDNNGDYLNSDLEKIPFFVEASKRNRKALCQLQHTMYDKSHPFMYLLTNCVTSKLDLPSISADSKESTANIFGTAIQYRGSSYKSDNGYDFTLSFTDTSSLDIYMMVKAYDEYMRLIKTGEVSPMKKYITSRIISEQFSIYKFLVGGDGETILYYAKLTGCYFTDVPRSDLSDPGNDGFKYSISFHAQFVEDSNPMIINEFNRLMPKSVRTGEKEKEPVYKFDKNYQGVLNNDWVDYPIITEEIEDNDLRVKYRGTKYDYRLKWVKM